MAAAAPPPLRILVPESISTAAETALEDALCELRASLLRTICSTVEEQTRRALDAYTVQVSEYENVTRQTRATLKAKAEAVGQRAVQVEKVCAQHLADHGRITEGFSELRGSRSELQEERKSLSKQRSELASAQSRMLADQAELQRFRSELRAEKQRFLQWHHTQTQKEWTQFRESSSQQWPLPLVSRAPSSKAQPFSKRDVVAPNILEGAVPANAREDGGTGGGINPLFRGISSLLEQTSSLTTKDPATSTRQVVNILPRPDNGCAEVFQQKFQEGSSALVQRAQSWSEPGICNAAAQSELTRTDSPATWIEPAVHFLESWQPLCNQPVNSKPFVASRHRSPSFAQSSCTDGEIVMDPGSELASPALEPTPGPADVRSDPQDFTLPRSLVPPSPPLRYREGVDGVVLVAHGAESLAQELRSVGPFALGHIVADAAATATCTAASGIENLLPRPETKGEGRSSVRRRNSQLRNRPKPCPSVRGGLAARHSVVPDAIPTPFG